MIPNENGDEDAPLSWEPGSSESDRLGGIKRFLLIQSKSPRRVKVYLLQGEDWLDNGTGYCMGKVEPGTLKPYFIVTNEHDSKDVILRSYLEGCIQYQRQQETLIVWSDSSGKDLALSFQENEGCADLCDFIVKVQQENLSPMISLYYVIASLVQDGNSSVEGSRDITELIAGPITFPPLEPVCEDLAEMLDIFSKGSNSLYSRFKILSFVVENDYLSRLYALFVTCEKKRDLQSLHLLNDLMKLLLLYNEAILFNYFFSCEETILALAAMLEYDREYPTFKADNRSSLKLRFKFECLNVLTDVPLFAESNLNILRMEYILSHFRSVFVSMVYDDHIIGSLSSMVYKSQLEVLNYLRRSLANGNFLETLFLLYESDKLTPEERRVGIRMIHYYAMVAKCHVAAVKPEFYGALIRCGFLKMITAALEDSDPDILTLGTELAVTILDQDIALAAISSSNESHVDELEEIDDHANDSILNEQITSQPLRLSLIYDVSLSVSLSRVLLQSRLPGLQMQAYEAIKSVLYAAAAEISAFNDPRSSDDESTKKEESRKCSEISEKHHRQFYASVAPVLFEDFLNLYSENKSLRNTAESNLVANPELYQHVCDVISFCCREHDHNMCRSFLLETGLLNGLFSVLTLRVNVLLKLAVIRSLKSILLMDDLDVSLYLIRHDLFNQFFSFFEEVVSHNSCANSLCLDLLSVIQRCLSNEAGLVLAAYVHKVYRDFLETRLDFVPAGRSFLTSFQAAEKLFSTSDDSKGSPRFEERGVSTDRLSSPICEVANGKGSIGDLLGESGECDVPVADLFQDIKLQNVVNKRRRNEIGEGEISNGDCFQESAKRKTPVLWADKPALEEEACT